MKKMSVIVLCIIMILSLCACGEIDEKITFSKEPFQTLQIEIYYLEKNYSESDVHNFRDENTPLCVLTDSEDIFALMNDISSLNFTQEVIYFPMAVDWSYTYEGYVISVVYADGYDIIAKNGQFYYSFDLKGKEKYKYGHSDYSGEIEWSAFVEKYVVNE